MANFFDRLRDGLERLPGGEADTELASPDNPYEISDLEDLEDFDFSDYVDFVDEFYEGGAEYE